MVNKIITLQVLPALKIHAIKYNLTEQLGSNYLH